MEVSIPMANTNRSHLRVRTLREGAIMVALAQALSYLKFMQLPNGGSLTPAIFPIVFFALRWGLGQGLLAGFAFGLLQLIFDGAYAWGWQSMLLDYLVAFTPLGLAGFGTFDNANLYSLVYNGSYMLPNMLLALAIAAVLYIPLKKYFAGQDIRK